LGLGMATCRPRVGSDSDPPRCMQSRTTECGMGWTGPVQGRSTGEAGMAALLRRRNLLVASSMEQERGEVCASRGWSGAVRQWPHTSAQIFRWICNVRSQSKGPKMCDRLRQKTSRQLYSDRD
jgi:hypothetical protein